MTDTQFTLALSEDETFSQTEAEEVVTKYVCAVCHADLQIVFIPNEYRVLIVCIEHGNVCACGRVTHATVGIEMERSMKKYYSAIRALPELWGELIDQGFDYAHSVKIIKDHVCAVCGGLLFPTTRPDANVDIACHAHGNINTCGYTRRDKFTWNFNRMKDWERNHRRSL